MVILRESFYYKKQVGIGHRETRMEKIPEWKLTSVVTMGVNRNVRKVPYTAYHIHVTKKSKLFPPLV